MSPALGYCDLLSMVRSRPSCRDTRQHAAHELSRRFQPTHSNMQLTSDTDPCSRPEGSEPGRASSARLPATRAAHVTTRRGGPPGIALSRPTKRTLKLCQKGRDMFRPCHTSSTRRRTTVPAPPTRHTVPAPRCLILRRLGVHQLALVHFQHPLERLLRVLWETWQSAGVETRTRQSGSRRLASGSVRGGG